MSETASNVSDITVSSNTSNSYQSTKYDIMDILSKAYSITRQFKSDIVIPDHHRNKNDNTIIILKRNPEIDGDDQIIAEMNVKTMAKINSDTVNDNSESDISTNDKSSIYDSSIGSFSTISDSTSK